MFRAKINQQHEFSVDINENEATINGKAASYDLIKTGKGSYHLILDGASYRLELVSGKPWQKEQVFLVNGEQMNVELNDRFDFLLEEMGMDLDAAKQMNELAAPMPGLVLDVSVKVGDEVSEGDTLLVLEAMKMENVIKSEGSGVVSEILVSIQDKVDKNQVLIKFDQ